MRETAEAAGESEEAAVAGDAENRISSRLARLAPVSTTAAALHELKAVCEIAAEK